MLIPYLCILIAALLPYVWTTVAKAGGRDYDNSDPRGWLDKQANPRAKRGNAAQLNAFEAFPAFAASVLMAQFAHVEPRTLATLAVLFVIFRILHGMFYVGNKPTARSLVWFGGFVCMLGLMGLAIARIV